MKVRDSILFDEGWPPWCRGYEPLEKAAVLAKYIVRHLSATPTRPLGCLFRLEGLVSLTPPQVDVLKQFDGEAHGHEKEDNGSDMQSPNVRFHI